MSDTVRRAADPPITDAPVAIELLTDEIARLRRALEAADKLADTVEMFLAPPMPSVSPALTADLSAYRKARQETRSTQEART